MARAALGLSVRKLAAAAKVSPETVVRFERAERIRQRTIASLRQVLEAAGSQRLRCAECGGALQSVKPWRLADVLGNPQGRRG